ncbi:tyrosine decarboxylase-like isoform X2 [Aphidius gifuensis]|uniref:tyrosine decarboxylase-like isoform X2 n=1 Tax=Aphidius gifuensis TaxID=684658 RepID=UPI001CDD6CC3|nr:tyrosine decarboxylase-like isoform X2 [Aphidius gifuensis]
MNIEEFRVRGKEMIEYICEYLRTIEGRRVTANVDPGYLRPLLPSEAPTKPESWDDIMKDVESKIMPGITHWQHPRFHAYFPSGNSFPSLLGDMLSDAIGCIGFSWAASPAYNKNSKGGGVIQGSASECILVTMLAARTQMINSLKLNEPNIEDSGFLPRLVAYCSTESHSCVEKAAMICLVKLRVLSTDDKCRLRGITLESAMIKDIKRGLIPFYVSTTLGSTGCCSFDNLIEIGPVCKKYTNIWLHVDSAYAGNAFICPELRHLMAGIEYADSFNTNPNKWLLVNFDCSCLWVRDTVKLTSALVVDPLYLQHANSNESIDYRHWGIPLSRRFRALKLWFVLRSYGINGLQQYIRNHIRCARRFENLIKRKKRFDVLNDVKVGLVCFRLRDTDEINQELLANINASGKLHMIPSRMMGKYIIRFCVTRENANEDDIDYAVDVIDEHAKEVLLSHCDNNDIEFSKSPKSPAPLDKKLVRKFSFTRSVTRDVYKRTKSKTTLHDGATPIMVVEDNNNNNQNVDLHDDDNLRPNSR